MPQLRHESGTFLLRDDSANNHTTMQPTPQDWIMKLQDQREKAFEQTASLLSQKSKFVGEAEE